MSIESKTKEDIIAPYYRQNNGGLDEWVDYADVFKIMDEYAAQQNQSLLEALKRILPYAGYLPEGFKEEIQNAIKQAEQ